MWPCKINEQLRVFTSAVVLIIAHGKQLSTFMATFILSSSSAQYFYSCNFCNLLKIHFKVMWKNVCSKDVGYLPCKLVW